MYKFYYTNGYGVTSYIRKSTTSMWQIAWNSNIRKWLMRINLTCLMLLLAFMQVSLAANAQKISLSKKNAPLTEIFKELRKQSGYDFVINKDQIKVAKPVTIVVNSNDLINVLDKCFAGQPFTYSMEDKMIIVVNKKTEQVKVNAPRIDVKGRVVDENGDALVGASISVKGSERKTITDDKGEFSFTNLDDRAVLVISFIGYELKEVSVSADLGTIRIIPSTGKLDEVSVVSTGYQTIPKERATGSFVLIEKELINRKVGSNILDRLDGLTSGLIFNKNANVGNNAAISIRGRSTIFANTSPLIVLDNFPYDGNIDNINPNDIENITILKDAAAASIWGVRAGNGVIVITSKKGKNNQKIQVALNVSQDLTFKPDLHYQDQMSSSDYIELEQFLFRKGMYNTTINNGFAAISPAVAIMLQKRNGQISATDSITRIAYLKGHDVRDDFEKFIYRPSLKQQYAVNISGGSKQSTFYLSTGYNRDQGNTYGNATERYTVNANQNISLMNDKLKIGASLILTSSNRLSNNGILSAYTPYERFTDDAGNAAPVVTSAGLRKQYTDTIGGGRLLDWSYRPLDENYSNTVNKLTDYRTSLNASYNLPLGFGISVNYQYQQGNSNYEQLQNQNSFSVRNMVNMFSQINRTTGQVTRPVPLGNIASTQITNFYSNYGRAQLNYARKFTESHEVNFLAGAEIKDFNEKNQTNRIYGYNTEDGASAVVDYLSNFPLIYGSGTSRIPNIQGQGYTVDRFRSIFLNGSYSFLGRYILSISGRRDESNLFGVRANQKGVPLWSAGLLWKVNEEQFFNSRFFTKLALRATYGYNGNLDRSTTAYLTARNIGQINFYNTNYGDIINPPNPSLSWEKVKNINFGIDFSVFANTISGSIDYYIKQGLDLIGNSPIAPQTGIIQFKGNSANTRTNGFDIILNKNSMKSGDWKWTSNLLLSFNNEKITSYKVKQGTNLNIVNQNYVNPIQGYPYYALFSFAFSGLDAQGAPLGLLNGQISKNYSAINSSTNPNELVYHGSAVPTVYGSFRNGVQYKGFEMSFLLSYKFNYFFRRDDVFSGVLYSYNKKDYAKRWQNPGDENITNVPALIYPAAAGQQAFYQASEVTVEKADHIRLQDVRISYRFGRKANILSDLQVYCYLNNGGLLWKATRQEIDPDFANSTFINPKSVAFGLTKTF